MKIKLIDIEWMGDLTQSDYLEDGQELRLPKQSRIFEVEIPLGDSICISEIGQLHVESSNFQQTLNEILKNLLEEYEEEIGFFIQSCKWQIVK